MRMAEMKRGQNKNVQCAAARFTGELASKHGCEGWENSK